MEFFLMAAKKKTANGNTEARNIEARLAALRADFEALQSDMKGLYGDVSEIASERAALAMRSAEEIADRAVALRSEEHTSELQSQFHLVCRLLLEKKKRGLEH